MSNYNKDSILYSRPKTFISGLNILFSGFGYALKNKSLLTLALIPVGIAFLSLYFGFSFVFEAYFKHASNFLIDQSVFDFFGGSILLWLSKLVLKILIGFVSFLTFYILLQIVYIPICSLLAERVLAENGIVKTGSLGASLAFNMRMLRTGLVKSFVLIFAGVLCFVGSFIPVFNFLPIYFALMVLAYDCFDYGLELYGLSFRERISFIRKDFVALNGHAGVLFLFSFIPGLLLLTLPFSVIGASLFIGGSDGLKRKASQ